MKKILISVFLSFAFIYPTAAQHLTRLKFNGEGEFKIVQFTDTHIDLIKGANLDVFGTIKEVLESEKPDLAILTGDIVTQNDPQKAYRDLAEIFAAFHIPWAMVFGNHDSEHNFSRKELSEFLQKLPLCLNKSTNLTIGFSNFTLPVYGSGKKPESLIYCMDSNDYSTLKPKVNGYGWFTLSQIEWYKKESRKFTLGNNSTPLPAIAFFHIPLPEYNNAWNTKKGVVFGGKPEEVCCPDINSGMFTAMLECGDVMGTFVGHDHTNDYIGLYYNIALAYGRVTKKMKDPADPLAGGRVILLKEDKREFDTWIREVGGKKVLACSYPASFVPKK